jgi:lipopolysaccharide transport system ATP-binding protein
LWALRHVNLDVERGEVVGIIGTNGAGKSTLLKVVSRITQPTEGMVALRGRVGSLLEVGTGFHPELTGRENIFLNGAILGMKRREVRAKFERIVAFAEVSRFLDTPVKRYSSGMYTRLAFAVAAHLNPEILIVDEVLAVGDAEFQRKCLGKMKDVAASGRTVLFVSHNMNSVLALCSRAIHMRCGTIVDSGAVPSVIDGYMSALTAGATHDVASHPGRSGNGPAVLQSIIFEDEKGIRTSAFRPEQEIVIRLSLRPSQRISDPRVSVGVNNGRGERVFAIATFLSPSELREITDATEVVGRFRLPPLIPGQYALDIGLADGPSRFIDAIYTAAVFDAVDNNYLGTSYSYFSEMGPIMVRSSWTMEQAHP